MKTLQKLFKNKGFTLVECVVAIAVFAVLTLMVLMIIGGAEQTSKMAQKSETDLNNLVQNVVQDETNKKYGVDSHTLNMKFGSAGKDFSVSYSVVDGYKNFVVCPSCGHVDNNIEFMAYAVTYLSSQYNADVAANHDWLKDTRLSHWFDVDTMNYTCPSCSYSFVENDLQCQSCLTEGGVRDMTTVNGATVHTFTFNPATGSFTCAVCGSGSVKEKGLDDAITGDSSLYVSGISANAIRYGKIEEQEDDDVKEFIKLNGAANQNYTVTLNYSPSSNSTSPGKYKLKVTYLNIDNSETANMTFTLPGSYICNVIDTSTSANGLDNHARVIVQQSPSIENPEKTSTLFIDNITRAGTGTSFEVTFTLTNYANNASFDYDYQTEGGLLKHWYKCSNATFNMPRTDLS